MVNNLLLMQVNEVLSKHPLLNYDSFHRILNGRLIVDQVDNDGYTVKIDLKSFPRRFPIVWEVGERIPTIPDRHINTYDNSCCFTTLSREQILLKKQIKSILHFIDQIVIPFFQNNTYFEIEGKYKYGEYSHGIDGIIEGYFDILNTTNIEIVLAALRSCVDNGKIGRNEICFCNSGYKIKKCHLWNYEKILLIDIETIKQDLDEITSLLKSEA